MEPANESLSLYGGKVVMIVSWSSGNLLSLQMVAV